MEYTYTTMHFLFSCYSYYRLQLLVCLYIRTNNTVTQCHLSHYKHTHTKMVVSAGKPLILERMHLSYFVKNINTFCISCFSCNTFLIKNIVSLPNIFLFNTKKIISYFNCSTAYIFETISRNN